MSYRPIFSVRLLSLFITDQHDYVAAIAIEHGEDSLTERSGGRLEYHESLEAGFLGASTSFLVLSLFSI